MDVGIRMSFVRHLIQLSAFLFRHLGLCVVEWRGGRNATSGPSVSFYICLYHLLDVSFTACLCLVCAFVVSDLGVPC